MRARRATSTRGSALRIPADKSVCALGETLADLEDRKSDPVRIPGQPAAMNSGRVSHWCAGSAVSKRGVLRK